MNRYRVAGGEPLRLAEWDPQDQSFFSGSKEEAKGQAKSLNRRLESLQELLWAEGRNKVLVVLQAMDTGGKDGTIRHVFDGTNPQGVRVASFKKPTDRELSKDYLWRVHQHTPGKGQIVIFNRSHYEDVLVVRVHELVPEDRWRRRYEQINAFEKMLAEEGTTILKFYLHISKEEQKARLQARLDVPEKNWKFSKQDLSERRRWGEYEGAYEEMLQRTSTDWAPWHAVPADRKWYRNLYISSVLVEALEGLNMSYPEPEEGLADIVIE